MTALAILLFVLLGLFAGGLSGLLGIGGGVILVPALVFLFGLSQHLAQGTTLALMVPPIGLLAAWHYYKQGHVDLRIAALVCLGFAGGGWIGAHLAADLSNALLERVFGIGMLLIALKMLFWHEDIGTANSTPKPTRINLTWTKGALLVVLGVIVGTFSGLLGIGGGVIMVPALMFGFGMSQHQAQGTTLALMVPPIGLLGALEYYHLGDVSVPISALICLGFFLGALLGAQLAGWMSSRTLSKVFGLAMILIAIKMLLA